MIDRIDVRIEVPAVPPQDLRASEPGESSATVRKRVAEARERALRRQGKANAELSSREVDAHCALEEAGASLLTQSTTRLALSARAYHRILAVARSIADLAGARCISAVHLAEAIQYRRTDQTHR